MPHDDHYKLTSGGGATASCPRDAKSTPANARAPALHELPPRKTGRAGSPGNRTKDSKSRSSRRRSPATLARNLRKPGQRLT